MTFKHTNINVFMCTISLLQMITNGIYRSIEHRATVNSAQARLSVATFYNPGPGADAEIGPAHSLINEQNPALYRRLSLGEYVKGLFARKLRGKSYINTMKLHHGEE